MKTSIIWLRLLASFFYLTFLLAGCETEISVEEHKTNKRFFLSDFTQKVPVYTKDQANQLIRKDLLGENPKNAVVALVFNKDGSLLTPEEFNAIIASEDSRQKKKSLIFRFTNLTSFYEVTKSVTATQDYTKEIPSSAGKSAYVYDAYQSSYRTQKEIQKAIETMAETSSNNLIPCENCRSATPYYMATFGDIFIDPKTGYDDQSESITGHAAICHWSLYGDTFENYIKKVRVGEAQGYRDNDEDEVIMQPLEVNWATRRKSMWRLVSYLDKSTLLDMANFVIANTTGSPTGITFYNILAEKDGEIVGKNFNANVYEDFYCSLFAWQGYKDYSREYMYTGKMDIDSDDGYWCSPTDILLDTNPKHFYIKQRFR